MLKKDAGMHTLLTHKNLSFCQHLKNAKFTLGQYNFPGICKIFNEGRRAEKKPFELVSLNGYMCTGCENSFSTREF
jgi:hypothetical protein